MVVFQKILASVKSSYNGKVEVIDSLAWGTYIQVEGLTQSGGVVKSIWKKVLTRIKKRGFDVKDCLILGLGGGTVAKLISDFWPKSKITGVDIDSVIVELGKKYLGIDDKKVEIKIADALDFVSKNSSKYDFIIVDLYRGFKFPEKFSSNKFLERIFSLLKRNGLIVFNRLYTSEAKVRKSALNFGVKLEKFFDVEYFYPQANLVFICSKPNTRR